jgi:hypothetical protein
MPLFSLIEIYPPSGPVCVQVALLCKLVVRINSANKKKNLAVIFVDWKYRLFIVLEFKTNCPLTLL